ncbi:hypothetical protein PV325_006639 [Microctonus aethiopoides]|nr:hypothetical protein PV325_006639 [Microctonus aethiopoides]
MLSLYKEDGEMRVDDIQRLRQDQVYTHTQHGIAKTWSRVEGKVKENDREYANVYMLWEGKHPPRFNRKRKPRAGRTHPIQMPQAPRCSDMRER